MLRNKKGISLIVLIITILVVLILTSVIVMSFDNNSPIGRANEAKFKSDLSTFRDELMATHTENSITNVDYSKEDINVDAGNIGKMRVYIPDITEEYANKLLIKRGNLLYINDETSEYYYEEEKNWAKTVGIQSPYENVGDADGDGKITKNDWQYIQTMDQTTKNSLTDTQHNACDANGDGVINVYDATAIQKYLTGIAASLPYSN